MGLRKKLRKAAKMDFALSNGRYYRAPTVGFKLDAMGNQVPFIDAREGPEVGPGAKRAADRLARHRKEQAARLAGAAEPAVTRQQLRAAHRRAA